MQRAKTSIAMHKNKALEIRYEDLLQQPEKSVRRLNDFCQLENSSQTISNALKVVRPAPAFAYKNNPDLALLAADNAELLNKFGY
jgi:hypothetical protein